MTRNVSDIVETVCVVVVLGVKGYHVEGSLLLYPPVIDTCQSSAVNKCVAGRPPGVPPFCLRMSS